MTKKASGSSNIASNRPLAKKKTVSLVTLPPDVKRGKSVLSPAPPEGMRTNARVPDRGRLLTRKIHDFLSRGEKYTCVGTNRRPWWKRENLKATKGLKELLGPVRCHNIDLKPKSHHGASPSESQILGDDGSEAIRENT